MTDGRLAVTVRGVKKSFPLGDGRTLDVLDVDHLALPAGSCTVITGRSGAGKTTLLNIIAGVSAPTAGTVVVDGADLFALPESERDHFRARHVGYVFQTFNLLSALSALENVMLSMMFAHRLSRHAQRVRARELLVRVGLGARLAHKPAQLSRGEQQRVAIARALATDPPLILADEPCASLDAATAREVLAAFLAACHEDGKTSLIASHDEAVIGAGDRVVDLVDLNRAHGRSRVERP